MSSRIHNGLMSMVKRSSESEPLVQALVTKLRLERNRTRLFRSHEVSSSGGRLKPPSDDPSESESSLRGGRRAAAKTVSN